MAVGINAVWLKGKSKPFKSVAPLIPLTGVRTTLQLMTAVNGIAAPVAGANLGTVPAGVCVGLQLSMVDNASGKPLRSLTALATNTEKLGSKLVRFFAIHELRKSAAQFDGEQRRCHACGS